MDKANYCDVVGALILFAAIAAWMGWLPLNALKNDLLRSLQRLNSEAILDPEAANVSGGDDLR